MAPPLPVPTDRRLVLVNAPELAALPARHWTRIPAPLLLAGLRAGEAPHAIGFALFAASPDPLDLLDRLQGLRYAGRVLALAPPLPNRSLVQRELLLQAPGLRLWVLSLAALRG